MKTGVTPHSRRHPTPERYDAKVTDESVERAFEFLARRLKIESRK